MSDVKTVSAKYARRDFRTIGLVLILYSLIALYVPIVLDHFVDLYNVKLPLRGDIHLFIRLSCLIIGTLLPFVLLRSLVRGKREHEREYFGLREFFIDFIVFFTMFSLSLFLTHSLAIRLSLKGNVIGAIGFSLEDEKLFDPLYIAAYIVIIPIIEEYAYRGVLLKTLSRYGKYFAIIACSLIYALAHSSISEMIPAFAMSYLASKVALKYRSIRPVIALHMAVNILFYVIFIVPSALAFYAYIVLALIYVVAGFLIITRTYMTIRVRKTSSSMVALSMFFSTSTVVLVLALLVVSSLLSIII